MKQLYDMLAMQTLSDGIESAWKNMEADDSYRAISVAQLIQKFNPKSVLEVAAGYGFVTSYISRYNPGVPITCLEIASPFCEILRAKFYEVIEDDLRTADLRDRKWDVVTIMQVLEHLKSWNELESVLDRVSSWADHIVVVEIPEGGPIDGERHILQLTGEKLIDSMKKVGLLIEDSSVKLVSPQGKQRENGYTWMVQIVGRKKE